MTTIRHIGPGSVFKMAAVTYGLLLLLFGCLALAPVALLGPSIITQFAPENAGNALAAFGGGLVGALVALGITVVAGAIVSGIFAAIAAVIYNIIAGWVGGIAVDFGDRR